MATIDSLLLKRNTKRIGASGNIHTAKKRFETTRFIAKNFVAYDQVRSHLLHPHQHKSVKNPHNSKKVIDFFLNKQWIKVSGKKSWMLTVNDNLRFYLAGGWLEEYIYFAHLEAGADEAYFGQKVLWEVDGIEGKNEIDVIARRGNTLSFTSCKAISAYKTGQHMERMRHFITETNYWDVHFANDNGRALLVVTADFIDELNDDKHRYPELTSRATILDVSMLGLEDLKWDKLVESIDKHWN